MNVGDIVRDAYNRASLAALYIDVQNRYVKIKPQYQNDKTPEILSSAAKKCDEFSNKMRLKQVPNLWVACSRQHSPGSELTYSEMRSLSAQERFEYVTPQAGEIIVTKREYSAIKTKKATLLSHFKERPKPIDTVMFLGLYAQECLWQTVHDSIELIPNMKAIIISDATNMQPDKDQHQFLSLFKRCCGPRDGHKGIDTSRAHICQSETAYDALGLN